MELPFVLVTGCTSGIGKEIAIQLSKENNIILNGRNLDKLNEIKKLCSNDFKQIIWHQDLYEITEVEKSLITFLEFQNIAINKFVHSAGVMRLAPLRVSTIDILLETFNTNLFSASLICKVLVSKKNNQTSLKSAVFISSNLSNMGAKAMSAYGASKGALDSLMRCLSIEFAPKVRFNSVLPGAVLTEMTQTIFDNEEVKNRMEASYPLGLGKPNDIFKAVDFLLSENSSWITGQQFTVDGGRTINISS